MIERVRHNSRRHGFTLIELVVVIILLGVTAAIVLPRVIGGEAKRAEQTAKSVASMLGAVAQRDATSFEPMLISYSRDDSVLEVSVMREREGERSWQRDLFIDRVAFEDAGVRSASVDGNPLDNKAWSIEVPVNTPRPLIEIVVAVDPSRAGSRAWRVVLRPGASAARVMDASATLDESPENAVVVDLDALGLGESAW